MFARQSVPGCSATTCYGGAADMLSCVDPAHAVPRLRCRWDQIISRGCAQNVCSQDGSRRGRGGLERIDNVLENPIERGSTSSAACPWLSCIFSRVAIASIFPPVPGCAPPCRLSPSTRPHKQGALSLNSKSGDSMIWPLRTVPELVADGTPSTLRTKALRMVQKERGVKPSGKQD